MVALNADSGPRCAEFAREVGLDPIGSAGSYDGYLLLEWPLPWPRDIGDVPELAPVVAALAGTGLRLQGLVPLSSDESARRAVLYRRRRNAVDGFAGYERVERVVACDRVVDAALALVGGDGDPAGAPADVSDDVLVCTHGRRDTCCGSMGMGLVQSLADEASCLGGDVRLWRTSHTGGHRFAPTAIVLPQGTAWAFADADLLRAVVHRQGDAAAVLPRYRGCAGMGSPAIQAVEREAFARVGWDWLDWARRGEDLGDDRVVVEGESPSGERLAIEATVEVTRMVPVPECGRPLTESKKSEPEFRVLGYSVRH
jgi:hypothetical protein